MAALNPLLVTGAAGFIGFVDGLRGDVGFRPAAPIAEGIAGFVMWYRAYTRETPVSG